MAANPINRSILRTALERPLEGEPERLYEVGPGDQEVLFVAFVIERWLQSAPTGPIEFDSEEAEWAVDALVEGWSATVVHMLAREPMTLDELDHAIDGTDRRALRRQIATMQKARQVAALDSGGGEAIYALTDWLRSGIAPIIAAARAERRSPADGMSPIDELDVEAGFRLSLALLELPKELSGICRLGLNLDEEEQATMTGVTAQIEQGYVISCTPGLTGKANAWAAASAGGWLDTVIERDTKRVRTGGDRWLARALLDALHKTMFGVPVS